MPKPSLARPPSWHPEGVLERLREGQTVTEQARAADEELAALGYGEGERPSIVTYRNDIINWRRNRTGEHEGYAERYMQASAACATARGELRSFTMGRIPEFTAEKKGEFLQELSDQRGDVESACEAVGVSAGHVFHLCNPRAARYDPEFAEAFQFCLAEKGAEILSAYFDEALVPRAPDAHRRNGLVLTRLGESLLPNLLNPKKRLEVESHHTVEILPAGVTRQIAQQTKAFLTAEVPAIEVGGRVLTEKKGEG